MALIDSRAYRKQILPPRLRRVALNDLGVDRLFVIYPGAEDYALDDGVGLFALPSVEKLAACLHLSRYLRL